MTEQVRRPRLLVGVGSSEASQSALRWALREAERRDGVVIALTAWSGGTGVERRSEEQLLVARVRAAIAETGVRGRTRPELVVGPVEHVLAVWAADADVLVLGAHADTG